MSGGFAKVLTAKRTLMTAATATGAAFFCLVSPEVRTKVLRAEQQPALQVQAHHFRKTAHGVPPGRPERPTAVWDHNWDKREPEALVKPPKANASPEDIEAYNRRLAAATPTARRVYILVRHGQYDMSGPSDDERYLTDLGREQADLTGKRLAEVVAHLGAKDTEPGQVNFVMSTMARASETARIILKHFSGSISEGAASCDLIREGAPCEPVPNVLAGIWDPEPHLFYEEGARIEAGFRRYIHRADPSEKQDSVNVLVCHGNVIRYFVCRALQLPPEAWLRFSVHNGSYTVLTVLPSGRVSASVIGESGHLPMNKLTFN